MIKFSARGRAIRQLSALRRLAGSANESEAASAKKKADRVQRRFGITDSELQQSDEDMSNTARSEGWDSPWRLTLLGAMGEQIGVSVSYDLPKPDSNVPGVARLRGHCAGRILREATTIRNHIEKQLLESETISSIDSIQITQVFDMGSLTVNQVSSLTRLFGEDAVEIYALGLVSQGVHRIIKKLHIEIEKQIQVDLEEIRKAERQAKKAPEAGDGDDGAASRPPEPLAPPSPFMERYNRLRAITHQLMQSSGFVQTVDKSVVEKVWDSCAGRLAGEEPPEPEIEIRGLLTDSRHGRNDDEMMLRLCTELNTLTRLFWSISIRDLSSAETSDGYWRVSVDFNSGRCILSGLGRGITTFEQSLTDVSWPIRLAYSIRDVLTGR